MDTKTRDPKIIGAVVDTLTLRHNLKLKLSRSCLMRAAKRETGYVLTTKQVEQIIRRSDLVI